MTQIAIKQQLDAQKKTTEQAIKSKESAMKYLRSIGVLKEAKNNTPKDKTSKD